MVYIVVMCPSTMQKSVYSKISNVSVSNAFERSIYTFAGISMLVNTLTTTTFVN